MICNQYTNWWFDSNSDANTDFMFDTAKRKTVYNTQFFFCHLLREGTGWTELFSRSKQLILPLNYTRNCLQYATFLHLYSRNCTFLLKVTALLSHSNSLLRVPGAAKTNMLILTTKQQCCLHTESEHFHCRTRCQHSVTGHCTAQKVQPSWKRGNFNRPFDRYAVCSSGWAGAAYGAVHRARGSYNGFLLKLVLARQKLWWNRDMALKTIGPTNRKKNQLASMSACLDKIARYSQPCFEVTPDHL